MKMDEAGAKMEFEKLKIALQYTDYGFLCFTTPSADGQQEVVDRITGLMDSRPLVSFDCTLEKPFHSFSFVSTLVRSHPPIDVYILYNFQNLLSYGEDSHFFQELNFSRDPWANLQKLFLLVMTEDFEGQIMRNAPDFHSFFLASFHYNLEPQIEFPPYLELEYDDRFLIIEQTSEIIHSRYLQLFRAVTKQSRADPRGVSDKTGQLFLDFLSAWVQYAVISSSGPPGIVSSVLESLRKNEYLWAATMSSASKLEIMARAYNQLGKYPDAVLYFEKALQIVEYLQGENHRAAITLCSAIADSYYKQGAYSIALEWSEKALSRQAQQKEGPDIADTYSQLGLISAQIWDFTAAEHRFKKSLEISTAYGDEYAMARAYHNLGVIAQGRKDLTTAEDWYRRSLDIKQRLGDNYSAARTYHNLGALAKKRKDLTAAEDWYRRSLDIKLKLGDDHGAARTYHNLGALAQERRDFAAAEVFYKSALVFFERSNDEHRANIVQNSLDKLDDIIKTLNPQLCWGELNKQKRA